MTAPISIAVITGGVTDEHPVSVASATSAVAALRRRGHHCRVLTIEHDGSWSSQGSIRALPEVVSLLQGVDVVLPLVHGIGGEDGTLAALCDIARVPWIGSDVMAGAIGMDKWAAKAVARSVGVAVAPARLVTDHQRHPGPWLGPCVIKPLTGGSSLGVHLVEREQDRAAALDDALSWGGRAMIEDVVVGREIDIAVLATPDGVMLSAPLEIESAGLFDFDAKYGGHARFVVPAALTADQIVGLEQAASAIFDAIGCAGVARVDFFLTDDGWVFNEINTIPGFTASSQVPLMFAAAGLEYPDLLERLLDRALERAPSPVAGARG